MVADRRMSDMITLPLNLFDSHGEPRQASVSGIRTTRFTLFLPYSLVQCDKQPFSAATRKQRASSSKNGSSYPTGMAYVREGDC